MVSEFREPIGYALKTTRYVHSCGTKSSLVEHNVHHEQNKCSSLSLQSIKQLQKAKSAQKNAHTLQYQLLEVERTILSFHQVKEEKRKAYDIQIENLKPLQMFPATKRYLPHRNNKNRNVSITTLIHINASLLQRECRLSSLQFEPKSTFNRTSEGKLAILKLQL